MWGFQDEKEWILLHLDIVTLSRLFGFLSNCDPREVGDTSRKYKAKGGGWSPQTLSFSMRGSSPLPAVSGDRCFHGRWSGRVFNFPFFRLESRQWFLSSYFLFQPKLWPFLNPNPGSTIQATCWTLSGLQPNLFLWLRQPDINQRVDL